MLEWRLGEICPGTLEEATERAWTIRQSIEAPCLYLHLLTMSNVGSLLLLPTDDPSRHSEC